MKTLWLIVAGVCIVLAAVFLLRGDFNGAFVVAVIGLVAWFLNYRMQIRAALARQDAEEEENQSTDGNNENQ